MQSSDDKLPSRGNAPRSLLPIILGFELGLGVVAILLALAFGLRPWLQLHWNAGVVVAVIATIPMLAMIALVARTRWNWAGNLRRLLDEKIAPMLGGLRWWQTGLVSLAAGIGEELLFRGVVQHGLTGLAGPLPALLAAALLFGLAHALTPAYFTLATLIGIYLGALYIATDNLLVPILVHFLYDWIALSWLLSRRAN